MSVILFLGTGGQSLERDERFELCHTELGKFSRGARTRASLDCVMGLFLGTLSLSLGTLLLLLGTVLLVLGTVLLVLGTVLLVLGTVSIF